MTSTSSEAVNVDGRKQELIDASEASVFFFWFADTKKGTYSNYLHSVGFSVSNSSTFFQLFKRFWFFDVLYFTTYVWLIRH
ncbi:hypothetical protein HanXRQr2_Chr17g0810331 [Helianthus annuus]|uniref:Uncharacterized protein n=1 Tax=Helianthus annuus TaxID=4232 RepID=A0A9K3GV29_HELAN|nr:hypothetical protein HanXRQr2_Chr17g0810331 [Helianthus annuus]